MREERNGPAKNLLVGSYSLNERKIWLEAAGEISLCAGEILYQVILLTLLHCNHKILTDFN